MRFFVSIFYITVLVKPASVIWQLDRINSVNTWRWNITFRKARQSDGAGITSKAILHGVNQFWTSAGAAEFFFNSRCQFKVNAPKVNLFQNRGLRLPSSECL